jgi:hypothetical protein
VYIKGSNAVDHVEDVANATTEMIIDNDTVDGSIISSSPATTAVAQLRQMVAMSTKCKTEDLISTDATGKEKEAVKLIKEDASQLYTERASDLESGDSGDGLAVARPVTEHENGNTMFTPTAVEYDNDMKPKSAWNNQRTILYFTLFLSSLIIGTIGVVLGVTLTSKQSNASPMQHSLTHRETIGIYENIARSVSVEELNDPMSPYKKALDWITHEDPLLLTPDHPQFMQRYIVAYFYYATSLDHDWTKPCAPDSNQRDECKYQYPTRCMEDSPKIHSYRWLSKQDECKWAGIECDSQSQIIMIDLGKQ